MSRLRALSLLALACVTLFSPPARAGDPRVHWYTLETPHFSVHYHAGIEPVAQKLASVAEGVYRRLVPELGFVPDQKTELVLTDESEYANGFAWVLPYPTVRLLVSAPDDMSTLGDYDDWLTELVTHELTHILQISNVSGVPGVANSIFGPTFTPNHQQPNWIIEGLAVAMETEHTTGGRLRSTQFEMQIRADVLSGRFARLDEMSHLPTRWPGGGLWYLYGAKFIEWIVSIYGPDVYAAIATDYGAQVVPFGVNRAVRRATGRTYEDLYAGWRKDLERTYAAQKAAIERRGLREGRRLTHHGWNTGGARFLPRACGSPLRVAYARSEGHSLDGIYVIPVAADAAGADAELLARSTGRSAAFGPHCELYFDSVTPSERNYYFSDLYRLAPGERSPRGTEKNRQALTTGRRARDLDVSPDGRRIVFVTNEGGTTTLRIAELDPDGRMTGERRLIASGRFEQVYTPRFSPDGRRVAYGSWTSGGHRDIRVVDVANGKLYELWRDRAIEQQPAWSPDGRTLYFTSDRSGVANVYAYDLESRELFQVTNVVTGAYMPEPAPDGRSLVYLGYGSDGYDLYVMQLERARFLQPSPVLTERALPSSAWEERYESRPYRALPSLRPRAWGVSYGTGSFGNALTLTTTGTDAVGYHAFRAALLIETEDVSPLGTIEYWYSKLPFGFAARLFRSAAPRSYQLRYGEPATDFIEYQLGASSQLYYNIPSAFDAQSVDLSYTLAHWRHDLPSPGPLDPFAPLSSEPQSGLIGIIHLGYSFSNARATPLAVSNEAGFAASVAADFADPAWGSESTLTAFSARAVGYLPMPWLRHHVLALGLSGGTSTGSYARYGLYSTGGFADTPPFDAITTSYPQSSFVLRGYLPGQFVGSNYNLLNLEYRFPIWYIDRGISTLPGFLRTLSGTLFLDWGGTYERLDEKHPLDAFHVGVGAELWLNFVLEYAVTGNVRFGVARGLDSEAPEGIQTYFVAAAGF
ncbi:MAG TPA: hypothetical protein VGK73_27570 [Polyangiaceae bacterium]